MPPTNPTSCSDSAGSTSNVWQKDTADPIFSWSGADGTGSAIAGYAVYWGTSPTGEDEGNLVTSEGYDPTAVTSGTYYLRVSTKDEANLSAPWETIFIFRYDNSAPDLSNIGVTESNGVHDAAPQNSVTAPQFSFSGLSDPNSGLQYYNRYFGSDPAGTDITTTAPSSTDYSPGTYTDGTNYLRVQLVDALDNASAWQTVFTFVLDTAAPGPVSAPAIESHGYPENTWLHPSEPPVFSWDPASGADGYRIYWGTDPAAEISTDSTTLPTFSPALSGPTGHYSLRVQPIDNAGNQNSWVTMFSFWLDNTAPGNVGVVTEGNGLSNAICQSDIRNPTFSWTSVTDPEGPVAGYYYYWGESPTGTANTQTDQTTLTPGLVPRNEIYYFRLAPYDAQGNTAAWETEFILCHGDDVDLVSPGSGGYVEVPVPTPFSASVTIPSDLYPEAYYARLWYPDIHPALTPGKDTPHGHNSFSFSLEKASDLSQISSLADGALFTFHYDEINVLAMNESSLRLYKYDGNEWDLIQNSEVNTLTNTVTASIGSPGRFVVMGDPLMEGDRLSIIVTNVGFGTVELTGQERTVFAIADPWLILDATYSTKPWDINIRATDFQDASLNEIPIDRMKISIPEVFIDVGNNAPSILMGTPTSLTSLDQTIIASSGNTTGKFHFSPEFQLNVPAQSYKGTYTSQIVVTIIAGP